MMNAAYREWEFGVMERYLRDSSDGGQPRLCDTLKEKRD